jgi:hypothetical protein
MTVKFNPKGLIVTAAAALVALLAIRTGTAAAADTLLLIGWLVFLVVASIAIARAATQGRRVTGQAGAAQEILRWFTNDSDRWNL